MTGATLRAHLSIRHFFLISAHLWLSLGTAEIENCVKPLVEVSRCEPCAPFHQRPDIGYTVQLSANGRKGEEERCVLPVLARSCHHTYLHKLTNSCALLCILSLHSSIRGNGSCFTAGAKLPATRPNLLGTSLWSLASKIPASSKTSLMAHILKATSPGTDEPLGKELYK